MKRPGIFHGSVVGALLTALMIALFLLIWKIAGLSFPPFDLFDWLSGILPGSVVTYGIEHMVKLIRGLNLGNTAVVAKAAEQTMGTFIFFIGGITAGMITNIALRTQKARFILTAAILGAIYSIPFEFFSMRHIRTSIADPVITGIWIFLVFVAWGFFFGLIYQKTLSIQQSDAPMDTSRRKFLIRLSSSIAALTLAGLTTYFILNKRKTISSSSQPWSASHALPNQEDAVKPAPGTRPEFTQVKDHYRIDVDTIPPHVNIKNWKLKVSGLVKEPREITINEIRSYKPMHQFITLECISNPLAGDLISTTRWTGVSLQQILPELGLNPKSTHINIRSVDGFFESVSLNEIREDERIMLAYDWDGLPLSAPHGFPLRVYIPGRYGMKQPKWIESFEVTDRPADGYWVVRGWDRDAYVKMTSVIDTVAVHSIIDGQNGQRLVPVGGIAYSGERGISKVELQVDNGEWHSAKLRTPLSGTTWVIWRYDYPYVPGEHKFSVRCYDINGTPQITDIAEPHPSGATGLHSVTVKL